MASASMDYETANGNRFEDEAPRYDRDRSASPRRDDGDDSMRRRSASPGSGADRAGQKEDSRGKDDDAVNPGSNLFVTGIHPKLRDDQVSRLFEKYGDVERCQIMRDPHSGESRGFGFVKMVTSEQAEAARDGLQGENIEGRTFSIEKARRVRPRTPTPGKYYGPPKREGRGGGRFDRFDDRRRGGGGYGSGWGRDDSYRSSGGMRSYREDRGYDRNYDRGYDRGGFRDDRPMDRDERGYRGGYDRPPRGGPSRDEGYGGGRVDRYAGGRDERDGYGGSRGDDRRGGSGYERDRYGAADRDARPLREPAGASGPGAYDSAARAEYGPR